MSETVQITIDVPLGYTDRDELLQFMQSKLPGASVSIVHGEVSEPTVSEALVKRSSSNEVTETELTAPSEDSGSMLSKASDALLSFTSSAPGERDS